MELYVKVACDASLVEQGTPERASLLLDISEWCLLSLMCCGQALVAYKGWHISPSQTVYSLHKRSKFTTVCHGVSGLGLTPFSRKSLTRAQP